MWIKKNDKVLVLSGKEKGKRGQVLLAVGVEKFVVSKINVVKKHQKPRQDNVGGIVEKEAPIHQSKLMLVCPQCDAPTRPKVRFIDDGSKVRACRDCNEVI